MAELPFWPRAKYSSASRTSVRCRCRTSSAIFSHSAVARASAEMNDGVAVALDHLGGHRRGLQAEPLADALLDFRADVGEGAHRAGDLADPQVLGGGAQARQVAPGLLIPDGQLEPEGDGLGVDAVGAADLHGVLEFQGAPLQHFAQVLQAADQDGGGLLQVAAPGRYPPRRWR